MKHLLISLFIGFSMGQFTFAQAETLNVTSVSKAVEIGVHRIERLVTLKKIDPMFQSALYGMRAERTTEGGATYKIYGYSSPDADNQSSTITMLSDAQGKVLSYSVGQIYTPANPVNWPDKDALTLMEDALHFVLEGWVQYPEVKPFYIGLVTISIAPANNAEGKAIVQAAVTSANDARTLYIKLNTNGTFISHEIK